MSLRRRGRPVEPEPVSDAGDPPHGPRAGRQLTGLVVARQRARTHVNPHLLVVPGCLTRPTGDLDSQLSPRKRPRRSLSSPWYVRSMVGIAPAPSTPASKGVLWKADSCLNRLRALTIGGVAPRRRDSRRLGVPDRGRAEPGEGGRRESVPDVAEVSGGCDERDLPVRLPSTQMQAVEDFSGPVEQSALVEFAQQGQAQYVAVYDANGRRLGATPGAPSAGSRCRHRARIRPAAAVGRHGNRRGSNDRVRDPLRDAVGAT